MDRPNTDTVGSLSLSKLWGYKLQAQRDRFSFTSIWNQLDSTGLVMNQHSAELLNQSSLILIENFPHSGNELVTP